MKRQRAHKMGCPQLLFRDAWGHLAPCTCKRRKRQKQRLPVVTVTEELHNKLSNLVEYHQSAAIINKHVRFMDIERLTDSVREYLYHAEAAARIIRKWLKVHAASVSR